MAVVNFYSKEQTDNLLADKANASALAGKQDTLVSGQNVKTINGVSILGSENIVTPNTVIYPKTDFNSFGQLNKSQLVSYINNNDNTYEGCNIYIEGETSECKFKIFGMIRSKSSTSLVVTGTGSLVFASGAGFTAKARFVDDFYIYTDSTSGISWYSGDLPNEGGIQDISSGEFRGYVQQITWY